MGSKKKTEPVARVQVLSYTQERLKKLAESQLEPKQIEIRTGMLKDDMFCHYGYDHTVAANTTDSVTRKSQVPVHDDLKASFRDMNVHLAIVCEEIHPDEISDIDNLPELLPDVEREEQDPLALNLSRFTVSAFKIVGNGENEGVVLTGQKQLSTGDYVKLETPIVKWHRDYAFVNELRVAIFNAVEEIEQYMNGKQAPQRQTEMDFGDGGNDGQGDEEEE
jgi:hypothetical protein